MQFHKFLEVITFEHSTVTFLMLVLVINKIMACLLPPGKYLLKIKN